jgi:hypothetical protein
MAMLKKYPIFLFALLGVVLLISACSSTVTGPTATSSLTPLQVIQKSADAMNQLKSSHIELQSSNSIQVTNAASTTPAASGTPQANATAVTNTGTPTNASFTIKGSGDEALPDQEQLKLTINPGISLAQIVQGNKIYVQNQQGQWFVLDKSQFTGMVGNPFASVNIDQNSLLGLVQHSNITDHGSDTLNGQKLRHISASLDKTALRQLLSDNPQLKGALGQQNIDTVLNNTKSFTSSIDVWIDETQFYLHRTELKLNLAVDTTGAEGTAPSSVTTNLDSIVDLSKFNDPVTITPPANATPTDNPAAIFGFGQP